MKYLFTSAFIIMSLIYSNIMAQEKQSASRKDLMTIALDKQQVSKVDIKEVTMPAGSTAAYHLHPCPVVGYIVSGSVFYQEDGKEPLILHAGEAFYEPKNKRILHFDNVSDTEPLVFVAMYLKEADENIIQILENH